MSIPTGSKLKISRGSKLLKFDLLRRPRAFTFPKNFLWGSATSSYQVEGGICNTDWNKWEDLGRIHNNERSGRACNHYELFKKDFDLIRFLGHNAHRLSLEWSRIEPEEGVFDEGAIAHYREVLLALKERGIEPMVTLHHFTNPLWLEKYGYWESEKMADYFVRYVKKVASELLPLAKFWITLNEPALVMYFGYMEGTWPPGVTSLKGGFNAFVNMIRAHAYGYHVLREEALKKNLEVKIGIAHHMRIIDPNHFSNPLDLYIAWVRAFFLNRLMMESLEHGTLLPPLGFYKPIPWAKGTQDFIGINYYSRDHVAFDFKKPSLLFGKDIKKENLPRTAMQWEIYPRGLFRMLKYLKKFKLPVYVTENGIAAQDDTQRKKFIHDHLVQVARAIEEGVDVRGYFYWSLMDNFEWLHGYTPRFGLLEMNYETFDRRIRPSAEYLKEIAETNTIEI